MYLGLDLGTSGVKAVLLEAGAVLAQATAPLTLSHPHPLWSEQNPEDWWQAASRAVAALRADHDLSGVRGIGLSGQMHGAVLLDAAQAVLRPAILWNDGRSGAECHMLEAAEPRSRAITGNLAMPGFTAPKLLWVRAHEPEIFAATRLVLLPKDWLRLKLTGEAVAEMSDAAGTLWLDTGRRRWSPEMLAATGLAEAQMPRLIEGTEISGRLRPEVARDWGLPAGVGCIAPGQAFVSLGTSGVVFVSDAAFLPQPERAVHAFCHCIPATWHRMSVILSAAASLSWLARVTKAGSEAALLEELAQEGAQSSGHLVFLPYLSGERTPHNDPAATGVFFGITGSASRADLTRAVLEGVAFALTDGLDALETTGEGAGAPAATLTAIGGGARNPLWLAILAASFNRPLLSVRGGEIGPALGAARLARIAAGEGSPPEICAAPPVAAAIEPDPCLRETLLPRLALYRGLYPALRDIFAQARQDSAAS